MNGAAPVQGMPSRMRRGRLVLVIAGAFAALVLVAVLLAVLLEPAAPKAPCPRGKPCGEPPKAEPLVNARVWRSSELGFALEYSGEKWKIRAQDGRSLQLASTEGDMALAIEGAPAGDAAPRALFGQRLDQVRKRTLGLADDTEPAHEVLSPVVGLHPGVGGAFRAASDTPQGTTAPLGIALMAAGNDRVSIVVVAVTGTTSEHNRGVFFSRADSILNTLRMPGDRVTS